MCSRSSENSIERREAQRFCGGSGESRPQGKTLQHVRHPGPAGWQGPAEPGGRYGRGWRSWVQTEKLHECGEPPSMARTCWVPSAGPSACFKLNRSIVQARP